MTRPAVPLSQEATVPRAPHLPCPCCGRARSADHVMCGGCWAAVPRALARAVEDARQRFHHASGGRRDPARLRATAHDLDVAHDAAVEAAHHAIGRTLH